MATATQKARATKREVKPGHATGAMEFLIFEDNAGAFRWTIGDVAGGGFAESGTFASWDAAEHDMHSVRDGAGSAQMPDREPR